MPLPCSQFRKLFMNEFPAEQNIFGRAGTFSNLASSKKTRGAATRVTRPRPTHVLIQQHSLSSKLCEKHGASIEKELDLRAAEALMDAVSQQQGGLRPEGFGNAT